MSKSIWGVTVGTPISPAKIREIAGSGGDVPSESIGDIKDALDRIIAIQNQLMGGGTE